MTDKAIQKSYKGPKHHRKIEFSIIYRRKTKKIALPKKLAQKLLYYYVEWNPMPKYFRKN